MQKVLPEWLVNTGKWISDKFATWGIDIPSWDTIREGLIGFMKDPKTWISDKFNAWKFELPTWDKIKAGLGEFWQNPVKYIKEKVNGWFTFEGADGESFNIFDKINNLFDEYVYNPIMSMFDTIANAIDGLKIAAMKWAEDKGTIAGKKWINFSEEIAASQAKIDARKAASDIRNKTIIEESPPMEIRGENGEISTEEATTLHLDSKPPVIKPEPLPVNAGAAYVEAYKNMQTLAGQQAADAYINSIKPGLDPKTMKDIIDSINNQGGISNTNIDKSNKTTIINDPMPVTDPFMNM